MCEYCRQYECPSACPSFNGHATGLGSSTGKCAFCEANIYDSDEQYAKNDKVLCAECAEELVSPELLELLDCADIKEFFDLLL